MPDVAVVTHATREDDVLVRGLREAGTRVIELPCVAILHLGDTAHLASAIDALRPDDWLVVTSPFGADAIAGASRPRSRVAAIGPATAARLLERGIAVDFTPSDATGAALARELPAGGRALLARSDRALPDAPRILRDRGFAVTEVIAYRTRVGARGDIAAVRDALSSDGGRVAIHLASPSALDGLLDAIEPALVAQATLHVSGRTTLAHVRERLGAAVRVQIREEVLTYDARR